MNPHAFYFKYWQSWLISNSYVFIPAHHFVLLLLQYVILKYKP